MRVKGTVLIVDDEAYIRDSLASVLRRRGFRAEAAASAADALAPHRLDGVDAVVTDLRMPGDGGESLLRRVVERDASMPVIVLTGHGTVASAVECIRAGAFDYLLKPADPEELVVLLERAIQQSAMRRELEYLRGRKGGRSDRRPLGESLAWQEVLRLADLAAPADTSLLLLGETGTGKEEIARYLHRRSARASGPFVVVNCAAVPTDLFESEFFGHRRGAFTGAVADRDGRFRVAHGGTLFLDEINSLSPGAQAKVLRVLEDGVFERVGDSRPTAVDVRIVCASNVDLDEEVKVGRFRVDLLFRINVLTIRLPPLRERREDIAVLARAFLEEFSARHGKAVRSIAPETRAALEVYRWPGNVRELRNVIERGVLLEPTAELRPTTLPLALLEDPAGDDARTLNLRDVIAAVERRTLKEALHRAGGVRREAARLLGVDARNLAYYLKKHGLMRWERG